MVEKLSLLNEFREPGYEGAVLTTFNCHLPFLEDVVVRRLHASGCRHIVVLADHDQLIRALKGEMPRRVGRDYHLVPIKARAAFHPKVVLLAGRTKGYLAIGSHNLTYAGLSANREVTSALRYRASRGTDHHAVFRDTWNQMKDWLEAVSDGYALAHRDLLFRLEQLAPWLIETPTRSPQHVGVKFGGPGKGSLFAAFQQQIAVPAREVTVAGAFFDQELSMLKRLEEALRPSSMIVAVDPASVLIPSEQVDAVGARFVRADSLGLKSEAYLHAKLVHVIDAEGQHHFWAGSANPSAPAWLASGELANHEAMVGLVGERAQKAADSIGLAKLREAPTLGQADWQAVRHRMELEKARDVHDGSSRRAISVVAVTDVNVIEIEVDEELAGLAVRLIDVDGKTYRQAVDLEVVRPGVLSLKLPPRIEIAVIEILRNGEVVHAAILHYLTDLAEHSRTGMQRRFRSALATLGSDAPDIAELFKCIEHVIDGEEERAKQFVRKATSKSSTEKAVKQDSLEISIKEIGQLGVRRRLTADSDLGYILDYLIKVLGQGLISDFEAVDPQGRTEEEQVGSDDERTDSAVRTEVKAEEILALCHKKVRRLANSVKKQMAAFAAGKVADRAAVTCTVAVLMLLRQLRGHDKHIWWVNEARGETTVPDEALEIIAKAITGAFLGHALFTSVPRSEDRELIESEEFGRLRGLLFWLASSQGLRLQVRPGFNETAREREDRLQRNADFLALSELIAGDPMAVEEARQAISTTSASDTVLLDHAVRLHHFLAEVQSSEWKDSEPEPGDIATHRTLPGFGIRVVLRSPGRTVELASPGAADPRAFDSGRIRSIPAAVLVDRLGIS